MWTVLIGLVIAWLACAAITAALLLYLDRSAQWHVIEDYHSEIVRCPSCNYMQVAEVEHSIPWHAYVHHCARCEHVIMESEWSNACWYDWCSERIQERAVANYH